MTDELAFLPATRLLALYRDKKLSPVEVMEATLRRLERYEGALNAFVLYDPQTAMAAARASEARWHRGAQEGLLDGVPVAIKDTLLTRGWPRLLARARSTQTRNGTRIRRSRHGCARTARSCSGKPRPPNSAGSR